MNAQPVLKLLALSGAGSRRQLADAVKNGRVRVNGQVIESFLHPVNVESDEITLDGKRFILQTEGSIYLMLNKPKGVISTTSDERAEKTVMDIIPEKYYSFRLYPVGRLDKDSTGLVLLTNDGALTYRLTHPSFEHEKEYFVQIEGILANEDKVKLEKGIELDGVKTAPARVKITNHSPYNYSIIIHEGRKRQIRRMFINIGYRILELKRVRISSLVLGNLAEGQIRELTHEEIQLLKKD